MNLPSITTLSRITDNPKALRLLLDTFMKRNSFELFALVQTSYPKTNAWVKACYHCPRNDEITLEAANELLGLYGVEAIEDDDTIAMRYLNTGDSYAETLCYSHGRFFVGSWGDYVEKAGL